MDNSVKFDYVNEVAVIGMNGRFPEAKSTDAFWQNLRDGVESISFFTNQELESAGIDPAVLHNPNYVKAGAILEDIELIDASFFGLTPKEAEVMDPQHRLFMECAWEALEMAGYDAETYAGAIGVYAGASINTYLLSNLLSNRELAASIGGFQTAIGSAQDFLTTRISYKFNLKGPSITVQTACSTSLVVVHLACQSLLNGECDMALAGGVSVAVPHKSGYMYEEGGLLSPDGHCRAFDAKAQGTVSGSGVGLVVLKRMADALADGDCIHAVIKGSAINNDGSLKVGYTAPSVDGQVRVIADALSVANIKPETVTYIEAHGTGTVLGDPIEINALTQVFRARTQKRGYCAIGSVKSNIGHLDAAAGVTGLIKVVLALKHKMLPPNPHFEEPNPQIDFANSPFYVNSKLTEWKPSRTPRRASVSSFGIGGTNAHVVLEEAPAAEDSGAFRSWQLLILSAKTSSALEKATENLAAHLKQHPDLKLADVAYTLQVGRRAFNHRRLLVCQALNDAVTSLEVMDLTRVLTSFQQARERPVVFMFPGQGAQYVNMALGLYQEEATFRQQVDLCSELVKPHLGFDLREVLYPQEEEAKAASQRLKQTAVTQPALFVIEYALAKLWMEWGVRPQAMIGHSIGEYVAACLAGVFSLEDALVLVAARGRLMQNLPTGAMLAIPLPEQEVQPLLDQHLSLAAVNGPALCVVSGPTKSIDALQDQLMAKSLTCSRLHTSHAFHSQMMNPIMEPFTEQVRQIKLKPPEIPYISNLTRTWIRAAEATNPGYWARHLRHTVRFAEGLHELLKKPEQILLEVGPGETLSVLTKQHAEKTAEQFVLNSLRHPREQQSDVASLLGTLGQLWLAGVQVDWSGFYTHERRHRLPLPTYPFERQRYWIEPLPLHNDTVRPLVNTKQENTDWFYMPVWKQSRLLPFAKHEDLTNEHWCWLIFLDTCGLGLQIAEHLQKKGQHVVTAAMGEQWSSRGDGAYTINPRKREDYNTLLKDLSARGIVPKRILHLWSVTSDEHAPSRIEFLEDPQDVGVFYSLLFLAQSLCEENIKDSIHIGVVSNNIQAVTGDEALCPKKATALGPCRVIPQEYSNITCRSVDIVVPESGSVEEKRLIDQLVAEFSSKSSNTVLAYRGHHQWVQTFEAVQLNDQTERSVPLREDGVYLITGGLAHTGLVFAEHLIRKVQARVVLMAPLDFPQRKQWETWVATHEDQDDVSCQIRKVQKLEALGGKVLVLNADTTNQAQMNTVVAQTIQEFGAIHGVIHAESVPGGGLIQLKTPELAGTVLKAKVHATLVLEVALQHVPLDFLVLFSSSTAVTGGIGQVDYCAANAFLDAFAHYSSFSRDRLTVSIDWDPFKWEDWQGSQMRSVPDVQAQVKMTLDTFGLTEQQSVEAFSSIMSSGLPQVIVSRRDFPVIIEEYKAMTVSNFMEQLRQTRPPSSFHTRPNLTTAYVPPGNETEQTIAHIWKELFGIEQVGIHDKFFELGGSSLLAIQLLTQLRNTFGEEISMNVIFERPTVAGLAEVIGATNLGQQELEEIDKIMEEIDDLSPEELKALFAEDLNLDSQENVNA